MRKRLGSLVAVKSDDSLTDAGERDRDCRFSPYIGFLARKELSIEVDGNSVGQVVEFGRVKEVGTELDELVVGLCCPPPLTLARTECVDAPLSRLTIAALARSAGPSGEGRRVRA